MIWVIGFFKRLLLLGAVVLLLAGGQYWLTRSRETPEELTTLRQTLDLRRQMCTRLYGKLARAREEWKAIPFYRMDRKLLKETEIKSLETLLNEAHAGYAAARRDWEDAHRGSRSAARDIWERYILSALLTGVLLLFVLPFLLKVVMYYGLARLVEVVPPRRPEKEAAFARFRVEPGRTSLELALMPEEVLLLRSGDWGKKRSGVTVRTRFLWSWKYPLVSLASGMCELVEMRPEPGREGRISVTSPEADIFVTSLRMEQGKLVIRPRYLVGVTGDLQIQTRWSFHLHDLLAGRIRQIILSGTGTVLVAGAWGVDAARPRDGQDWRIGESLLLGFSADAGYTLCRTETFWHYFRGQTALFDRRMETGLFLTQNNPWGSRKAGASFPERLVQGLLNAAGSLLGF